MISERYATAARVGTLGARGGASAWKSRLTARPALAGRERLTQALAGSVLIQLMLAVAFVALAALMYMAQQSQVSVQQMNIASLQNDRTQLVARNTTLSSTATQLFSLQRVDALATTQLHMTSPDITKAVWITPIVPDVKPIPPVNADSVAAERASGPLAWMVRAVRFVKSSL